MFTRVHIPSLGGATEWLNSEPLDSAELRGQVVLVNFWTLTCINWLRQEPCVRAWSQAYRNVGLVVIGGGAIGPAGQQQPDASRSGRDQVRVGARQCVSQLSAGTDVELGEHVVQMPLNRPRAEKQPRTDLRIRKPIAGQARDLALLRRQVVARLERPLAYLLARRQ